MKIRTITVNGIIAALYIAITAVIQPIAFSSIQFRVPEIFNHLVVFHKKYFFGVVIGVFFSNLFFSTMNPYDLIFGVAHSIISLALTIFIGKFVTNKWLLMTINSFTFSLLIFIIAFEIKIATGFSVWDTSFPFFETWGILAIGEFGVMIIGMPIMHAIHKRGVLD